MSGYPTYQELDTSCRTTVNAFGIMAGNTPMIRTKYRGYTICQQREFGPLKLLQWVEDGDFIIVKDDTNVMPDARFRTEDDARKVIDTLIETFRTLAALARPA